MTSAEARFNKSLRPRKPEGSLGQAAQDVHIDSHTAPELCHHIFNFITIIYIQTISPKKGVLKESNELFTAITKVCVLQVSNYQYPPHIKSCVPKHLKNQMSY